MQSRAAHRPTGTHSFDTKVTLPVRLGHLRGGVCIRPNQSGPNRAERREELRLIARYFGMNFVSLLSVFGLLEGDHDTPGGEVVPPLAVLTRPKAKTKQHNNNIDLKGPSL